MVSLGVSLQKRTDRMSNSFVEEEAQGWRYVESPANGRNRRKVIREDKLGASRLRYFDMDATNHLIAKAGTEVEVGQWRDTSSDYPSVFANHQSGNSKTPPMAINRGSVITAEDMMGGDDMMIEKYIQSRSEMQEDEPQGDDDESVDSYVTDEEDGAYDMRSSSLINHTISGDDNDEQEICFMADVGANNQLETPKAHHAHVGPLNPIPRKLLFLPILNTNQPSVFPQVGTEAITGGGRAEDTTSSENETEEEALRTSIFVRKAVYPPRPKKHFDSDHDHDSEQTYTTGDEWSFSFDERESESTTSGTLASSGRTSLIHETEVGMAAVVVSDDSVEPSAPSRASTAFARQQRGPVDIEISPVRAPVTSLSMNDMRKNGQGQKATPVVGVVGRPRHVSPAKGIVASPVGLSSTSATSSRNASARSTPDGHFRRINTRSGGAGRGGGPSGERESRLRADDSTPFVGELEL